MPQSQTLRTTRGIQQSLLTPPRPLRPVVPFEAKGVVYTKRWVVDLLLDLAGLHERRLTILQAKLRAVLVLASAIAAVGQGVPTRALIPGKPVGAGRVRQLSYSPDGRILAVVTSVGFQIRDADSGQVLNTIVDEFPASPRLEYYAEPWLSELAWSPDGKRIARAATGIEIWDPRTSAPERILPADVADESFDELAWSPQGNRLAARSESGIVVWDLSTGRRMTCTRVHPEPAPLSPKLAKELAALETEHDTLGLCSVKVMSQNVRVSTFWRTDPISRKLL